MPVSASSAVDRSMSLVCGRVQKGLSELGYVEGQNVASSTIGSAAKTIACRRSWRLSASVQLSLRLAILLRLQPKLPPRRSDCVWRQRGPGQAWVGRQPCPAGGKLLDQFFYAEVLTKRLGCCTSGAKAIRVGAGQPTNT